MIWVCCVWTGNKYGVEYVERLRDAVARHLSLPYEFVCITDHADVPEGVTRIGTDKQGWWAKIDLFNLTSHRRVFFDLDTVICDDITPLVEWSGDFGICENFTKLAGHGSWECDYGSCVMSLAPGWGWHVYNNFMRDPVQHMEANPRGDQQYIQRVAPKGKFLQDHMPSGFFLGYRDLTASKPNGCAVVVFAGSNKPHTCQHQWIKDEWV